MKDTTVIEFKSCASSLKNAIIRSCMQSFKSFIMLREPGLRLHPPMVFDANYGYLDVGIAPFITINSDGDLTLHSIALEEKSEKALKFRCHNCSFYLLDPSSILVSDVLTNRISKAIKVSVDKRSIEYIDLLNYEIHAKSINPLNNSVVYLSSDNTLYKLSLSDDRPSIEQLCKCDIHALRRCNDYNVLLCQCNSRTHAFISNKVYGMHIELDRDVLAKELRHVYGYFINNVGFIRIEDRGLVFSLGKGAPIPISNKVRPIAMLNNDSILGILSDGILVLYAVKKDSLHGIAKIDFHSLRDIHVDPVSGNVALTYDDTVYLFNVLDVPKYVKLKLSSVTYSAIPTENALLIFKKGGIDVYRVELSSKHIGVEGIYSLTSNLIRCANLGRNTLICLDKFGRIVLGGVHELLLGFEYQSILLRSTTGLSVCLCGYSTSMASNKAYGPSTYWLRSDSLLITDPETVPKIAFAMSTGGKEPFYQRKIDVNVSNLCDACILILDKNISIITNDGNSSPYTFLTVIDGTNSIKVSSRDGNSRFHSLVAEGLRAYLAGGLGTIEWGIGAKALLNLKLEEVLSINDSAVCLSKGLDKLPKAVKAIALKAICSNAILRQETCIDLTQCKSILKLYLEVTAKDNSISYLALPIDTIAPPKSHFVEDRKVSVIHAKGTQILRLPKKCIEVKDVQLDLYPNTKANIAFINHCDDVGATIVVNDGIAFLRPKEERLIEVKIDIDNIISDRGIVIFIYESSGSVAGYFVRISLDRVIAKAYGIALKVSRLLGIRNVYKVRSHVYENLREPSKEISK